VRIVFPLGEALYKSSELFPRSQQTGINEIEYRPEVAESVFDRRARQSDARPGRHLLYRTRLLCRWILDRLSLIEDGEIPRDFTKLRDSDECSVTCDDQIGVPYTLCIQ